MGSNRRREELGVSLGSVSTARQKMLPDATKMKATREICRSILYSFNKLSFPIEFDRAAHFGHRLLRFQPRSLRTVFDYSNHLIRILTKLPASFSNCAVAFQDRIRKRALPIDATNSSIAAVIIERICCLGRQKEPMHLTHIAVLRMPRIRSLDARAIGDHQPGLFANDLGRIN